MSKIEISYEDLTQIMILPQDKSELAEAWISFIQHGFIFDDFILTIPILKQVYRVKIEGTMDNQIIHIKKTQNNEYGLPINVVRYETNAIQYLNEITAFMQKAGDKTSLMELYTRRDKSMDSFIDTVPPMSLIQYIMVNDPKRKVEYIEAKERTTTSKPKKSYRRSNKNKTYSILDCIKIYEHKNKNRKKYEYTVESFPRRGGVRHLKSGKIVPYRSTTVTPKNNGNEKHKSNNYTI